MTSTDTFSNVLLADSTHDEQHGEPDVDRAGHCYHYHYRSSNPFASIHEYARPECTQDVRMYIQGFRFLTEGYRAIVNAD